MISRSTQQFYVLTAFASLFTVIGVTIAAATLTQILEESKEVSDFGEAGETQCYDATQPAQPFAHGRRRILIPTP